MQDKERLAVGWECGPCLSGKGEQNNYLSFRGTGSSVLASPLSCREGEEEETTAILQL